MTEPQWLTIDQVLWLHELQIREFGGSLGIRDFGLLESALSRVRQRFHYGELLSIPELAVAYAVAINANHPFLDGNKRVGFHCLLVFLPLHGLALDADPSDATTAMLNLAAGRLSERELQAWTQARISPRQL